MKYETFKKKWKEGQYINDWGTVVSSDYTKLHTDISKLVDGAAKRCNGELVEAHLRHYWSDFVINVKNRFLCITYKPILRTRMTHRNWLVRSLRDNTDTKGGPDVVINASRLEEAIQYEYEHHYFKNNERINKPEERT
jgi:hypothetical protein